MEAGGLDFGAPADAAVAVVVHSDPLVYGAIIASGLVYLLLSGATAWLFLARAGGAHLFGFCVSFGAQALLLLGTRLSERAKTIAVAFGLWAGIADVASWWAIRRIDARLHCLSILTGTAAGLFVVVAR